MPIGLIAAARKPPRCSFSLIRQSIGHRQREPLAAGIVATPHDNLVSLVLALERGRRFHLDGPSKRTRCKQQANGRDAIEKIVKKL